MAVVTDLEGTLTTGETWRALARYLRQHGRARAYRLFLLRRLPGLLRAKLRPAEKRAIQSAWLRDLTQFFSGLSEAEFRRVAHWVVDEELWPKRRRDVLAALRAHQIAGERLILASGTYQPILECFAAKLGALALGTPLEVRDGRLTGRLAGPVSVGEVKARRLHDLLGDERLFAAYGDTEADIPMLMLSEKPVAAYPDRTLRSTARALGWTLLEPN